MIPSGLAISLDQVGRGIFETKLEEMRDYTTKLGKEISNREHLDGLFLHKITLVANLRPHGADLTG